MLPNPYLYPDLSIDLAEVRRCAIADADAAMSLPELVAWADEYDRAYARHLSRAEGHRACALHRIEMDEEKARRAALPERERRILDLRDAAHLAPFIDSTAEAIAIQDAAERELAVLMAEGA